MDMAKHIMEIWSAMDGMNVSLILGILIMALILWNVQRDQNNDFDIMDLICRDGRVSEHKFMRFTAFAVSTWGFVYLIFYNRMTEWYFTGYMVAWTGSALINKWLDRRNQSGHNEPNYPDAPK
jgi:nitrogen fixation-related uncharacterized protein